MKTTKVSLGSNQKGMVSIIVTMILIIVMTLIVLAMAQNSNREQRQSLDRQLSDQAFYNAESGINDWAKYLYDNPTAPAEKTTCEVPSAAAGYPGTIPTSQIDGTSGVNSYSCLLYNKAPTSIEFDDLNTSDSIVVPIEPSGSSLAMLTFKWRAASGTTNVSGCNINNPASGNIPTSLPANCNVGGLRIDLVNPSGNRNTIMNNNFPAYLLPGSGGVAGTMTYSTGNIANQGVIGQAKCIGSDCQLKINSGLNLASGSRLFLHIKSLYSMNDVTITGCTVVAASGQECASNVAAGSLVKFNNAQIMIDSTGKSNDILRRVQVRVPAQSQYDNSGSYSLKTTQSICKLVTISVNDREANQANCP